MPSVILQHLAEVAVDISLFPHTLQSVIVAGEQLKITRQLTLFFQHLPGAILDNQYGPSEAHVVTAFSLQGDPVTWPALPPIGRPVSEMHIYLLDAWLQPVPRGAVGEIFIGGIGLSRGYLEQPDLTAEKFIPDPFGTQAGERLYRSGDLARYTSDGYLEFLGRNDQQVKIRGVRIEPGEIEATLDRHPAVRESIVIAREDEKQDKVLVAYVVTEPGQTVKVHQLRGFLRETLAEQMVPSLFVFLEKFPLNSNGKVDRRALPRPTGERPELATAYMLPRTALEQQIAAIWLNVLHLETVGIDDNFFDAGGHSLLLIEVQTRLSQLLGREIAVVDLFKHPTIGSLAAYLTALEPQPVQATIPTDHDSSRSQQKQSDIAVIGMAGRFPQAANLEEYWLELCAGQEMITHFTTEELRAYGVPEALLANPQYVKAGAVLEHGDMFDAAFFGFNAREAEMIDPQQRVFLECCWEAMENAGYDTERVQDPIGVFAGAALNTYLLFNLSSNPDLIESVGQYQTLLGNDKDFLATRVAYKLHLRGPAITVQTACSTSLVAVHTACQSLLNGECTMALAGGVALRFPQQAGYLYQEGGILSPDGYCRAFSDQAQGTVPGSGVGAVVLKRLADALADRDHIYGVIKGSAINNDGSQKVGYTAPSIAGQARAIEAALSTAQVDPASILYIEAHGTGTALGDPIEMAALAETYGKYNRQQRSCAIGSVKTNMGHADAASGIGGLLKVLLALHHKYIPPTLHYLAPNPQIDFERTPFYVNTSLVAWPDAAIPRRAAVSSLGIGGTNAHVIVEQAATRPLTPSIWPWQIMPLSARTPAALENMVANLATYLKQQGQQVQSADVAYTLQVGRKEFAHRCVVFCKDDAADALQVLEDRPPDRFLTLPEKPGRHTLVFLFPGQGTQYVNMARELYQVNHFFRAQIDQCARLLIPHLGCDIREILYPVDLSEAALQTCHSQLAQTAYTQPVLFVVEYALALLLRQWHIEPQAMIGHSLGEYTAACLADVLSLEDALRLVALRGKLIQDLPQGAMLSVGLPLEACQLLLMEYQDLSLAAINGPALSTLSGPMATITALEASLLAQGTECRRLQTSRAFHSSLLESILGIFQAEVEQIALRPPRIPYISNVTGSWITDEQATDPLYWVRHLRQTVRFADGVLELHKLSQKLFIEVGPGRTLSSLLKQSAPSSTEPFLTLATLPHQQEKRSDSEVLFSSVSKLWLAGVTLNWQQFWAGNPRSRVPLPSYPFERQRYLVEPAQQGTTPRQSGTGKGKNPRVSDWFYLPSWRLAPPGQQKQDRLVTIHGYKQTWLVFWQENSFATRLVHRLQQAGAHTILVQAGQGFERAEQDLYTIDPASPADYMALVRDLVAAGSVPRNILHCWTLEDEHTRHAFTELQNLGYYSLLFLTQALERELFSGMVGTEPTLRLEVISNHLYALNDSEPLCSPKVMLLGPCKVIPQEYAFLQCRCIDMVLPPAGSHQEQRSAEQVLGEIVGEITEPAVAYRGNQRWIPTFEQLVLPAEKIPQGRLREAGVYLITGGLGSLGFLLAEYLGRQYRAKVILTGRTTLPPRETWEDWLTHHEEHALLNWKIRHLQRLEEAGVEVVYMTADSARKTQMEHVLASIEQRFGALHGVIHAAGVTSGDSIYRPLKELDRTLSEEQFQAKAYGLAVLEDVLEGRLLDFCLLFSSNAAVLGGLGLTAYAAANLFMNAFTAHHNRSGAFPWFSINWDGWQQTASERAVKQRGGFATSMERSAMTADEGIQALQWALTLDACNEVIVSPGNLEQRFDLWIRHSAREEEPGMPSTHARPALQHTYVEPGNEIERRIVTVWETLLGIAPIGMHDDFFELGGHSLLATRLATRLQELFAVQLPLKSLFESPTPAQLARLVLQQLAEVVDDALLESLEA